MQFCEGKGSFRRLIKALKHLDYADDMTALGCMTSCELAPVQEWTQDRSRMYLEVAEQGKKKATGELYLTLH